MKNFKKVVSVLVLFSFIFSLGFLASPAETAETVADLTLLTRDAVWMYNDTGVDLGTSWQAANYDDSIWSEGKGPLGFGDNYSETDPTLPIGTVVEFGADPNNKNMTTYFRTKFNVPNLTDYTELQVYIHVDDGAVVYINGVEAFRRGITDGVVNYNTSAKFKPKEETFSLPLTALQEGINTIAAEVHQDDGLSSDLWFELGIIAKGSEVITPPDPPVSGIVDPAAPLGTVSKVTTTFYGDTSSSKGFTWYTTRKSGNSDLQMMEQQAANLDFIGAMTFTGRASLSTNSPQEIMHKAEADGLVPNTKYVFRVGDASLNLWSETGTFTTATLSGPFTFIDLADTQAKTQEEANLSAQTIIKALNTVPDAAFLALNGDIVDTGINEGQWDWMLEAARKGLMNTTILPAAGNHDEDPNSFIEHFDINPASGSATSSGAYYSVNYSNAHFVILNNNEDSAEYANFTPQQIQWMRDDVASARAAGAQWIIAIMHKGPYTTSNHATDADIMGPNGVRTKVAPIMEKIGIDLVLQGHDHIYARSKPLKNGTAAPVNEFEETYHGQSVNYTVNPDGTIYMIPSTAGAKVYYRNKKIDASYYDLFASADEHHAAVYGPDPSDPNRPKRGQVQNFTAFTIDGDKFLATSYEIDQNKSSAAPYVIEEFGIMYDRIQPVITVNGVTDGEMLKLNQKIKLEWSATDEGTGISNADGDIESGAMLDTSKPGLHTLTFTASDFGGNITTRIINYSVQYDFVGLSPILNMSGYSTLAKKVPLLVTFKLQDADGTNISNASAKLFISKMDGNKVGPETHATPILSLNQQNNFRYDKVLRLYTYTMDTKNLAVGNYRLRIELGDGSTHTFNLKLTNLQEVVKKTA